MGSASPGQNVSCSVGLGRYCRHVCSIQSDDIWSGDTAGDHASCGRVRGREDDKGSVSTKVLFSLESRVEVSSMGKGRGWEVHV